MQYIGIDFGTTNTSVVKVDTDEHGRRITLLGENGESPFSSIAAIPKNGGKLRFGRDVREQRLALADDYVIYTPKGITTAFLLYIKEYIKQNHSVDINEASFSFPVDFSAEARKELFEAAVSAGIEVKALVGESTASYIANRAACKAFSKIMVLDWGGGTFDISILRLTGTGVHEMSVWGERIGGDDIDRELAERVHAKIASESGISGGRFEDMTPGERDQMMTVCERAKMAISDLQVDYPLTVRNYGLYGTQRITLTEAQFNGIVEPFIRSYILKAINEALSKAGGLTPASIDRVIVVGGSSNLRLFEYAVTNLFFVEKIIIPEKLQWSAATGAALMQMTDSSLKLGDSVCVKLSDDSIYEILPKGLHVNDKIDPMTFALTEDSYDAHFIFTDSTGKSVYVIKKIPTKGFLQEKLTLSAEIGNDQIARIIINNENMGHVYKSSSLEINGLTFYYDISALDEDDRGEAYEI